MYICQDCKKISRPGEGLNKFVVQTRLATYVDKATGRQTGQGSQIVREIGICLSCSNDRQIDELDLALSANNYTVSKASLKK
jgi:hypothetical protein